jgi:hypothetical protein
MLQQVATLIGNDYLRDIDALAARLRRILGAIRVIR